MDEIKACVAYSYNGKEMLDFPASITKLENVKPVYKSFKGWKTELTNIKNYEDLPDKAREYISFIEDYTETPVGIVSVGYRREETMIRKDVWTK